MVDTKRGYLTANSAQLRTNDVGICPTMLHFMQHYANVVEIANHFVALYFSFARLSKIDLTASYISMLKSSAYAFITYNTDAIIEISVNLSGLSFVQSMLGVFYTLILLTMLISNAPKIESINKN